MEPISLIVTALVTGAVAVANEVGGQALKDAYGAVKQVIVDKYQGAKGVVELAESHPESADLVQAAETALTDAGATEDETLLDLAEQLQALLAQQEEAAPGSTIITVSGSGAVATGGGVAAGAGGIAVGGNVSGGVGRPDRPEEAG